MQTWDWQQKRTQRGTRKADYMTTPPTLTDLLSYVQENELHLAIFPLSENTLGKWGVSLYNLEPLDEPALVALNVYGDDADTVIRNALGGFEHLKSVNARGAFSIVRDHWQGHSAACEGWQPE